MSEFEGGKGLEVESGGQEHEGDELLSPEHQRQQENLKQIKEAADQIQQALIDDLAKNRLPERVAKIFPLSQEYQRDSEVACARMAMVYFGKEDPGIDGLAQKAQESGVPFEERTNDRGEKDIFAHPSSLESVLRQAYSIERNIEFGDLKYKAVVLTRALKKGDPVELRINEMDLHPGETGKNVRGIRRESVLAKGYRFNEKGELVIVANDPKRKVGGEIEIGRDLLEKALQGPVYVYSKR